MDSGRPAAPPLAFPALLASNVLLAFGPLLVRLADTGPVASGFWRLILATPMLFLLMRSRGQALRGLKPALWGMIVLGGLFFAGDLAAWHLGIMRTKVANATLFGNSTSLLLPLWGMLVLRHRPARLQVAAFILAAAGIALLMGSSYELSPRYLQGDLLCLFAGLMYTGYIIVMQRSRGVLGSWAVLAVSTAASTLPVLVFAMMLGENVIPQNWTPLLILAVSSQVLGQGLLIFALPWFSPLVVGLTLLSQPVVGSLIGWLVFGETMNLTDGVGAVAIAIALVLVRLPQRA
ncbi:DMT family transporter [Sphingobium aquiterrae]|uniref:DMT family transporter n=1 Tax=Sphingobium aquiterrae TaxID=2038656 RepID=UPI003AFA8FDB